MSIIINILIGFGAIVGSGIIVALLVFLIGWIAGKITGENYFDCTTDDEDYCMY